MISNSPVSQRTRGCFYMCRRFFQFAAQFASLEDDEPQAGHRADDQADDPGDTVGIDATGPHPEEQQQIGQDAYADVQQHIDQRILGEAAAAEGKDKIADQRDTAKNGNHNVQAVAGIAVVPVGKDEQPRHQQQQREHLPWAVVAAAQQSPQHQQCRHHPHQHQQAFVVVGLRHQQEIDGHDHHCGGQQHKGNDLEQQAEPPYRRRDLGPPGGFVRAGQPVLAQRAVGRAAADGDMAMGTGLHFSTSVA